jgi:hypothetical protein
MEIFLTDWWYTTSLVIVCTWCAQAQEANHQVGVLGGDDTFEVLRFEIFMFKC